MTDLKFVHKKDKSILFINSSINSVYTFNIIVWPDILKAKE